MATTTLSMNYNVQIPKYVSSKDFKLGLAEKPTAAKRIASILDPKSKKVAIKVYRDEKGEEKRLPDTVGYFVRTDDTYIFIIPAFGHLFTLVQDGVGWQYPVYDFRWVPNHLSKNNVKQLSKFDLRIESAVEAIRYLVQQTDDYVVMTDYDEEGEVIGGIILSELAGEEALEHAKRMKFSSFAKQEILDSLEDALSGSPINFGMYHRGLMRHYLDWLWGINLSRALMLSLKNTSGQYLTLSTGRVQGPTLSFIAERQREIDSYVPVPYFKINLQIKANNIFDLEYNSGLVPQLSKAKKIVKTVNSSDALVSEITSRTRKQKPPTPFNLSSLQNDAYRYHKISPSRTLRAAENLYLDAAISYPRTSSEKFPSDLDHKETIEKLASQTGFKTAGKKLLGQKKLSPKEGKKSDPAHPCIYPTGNKPSKMGRDEERVFSLIVHRYFSTFGKPSELEYNRINFDVSGEEFHMSGKRTLKMGWRDLAGPYGKSDDVELPKFKEGDQFPVEHISYDETFSRSPPFFNQSSLLKKMESEEIGTKATRADIIKSLFDRKYLKGDPINITPVGEIVNQVLQTYSSQVISVDLSRKLEHMGDMIESSINEQVEDPFTLADAVVQGVVYLHEMLEDLQDHETEVGEMISQELRSQRKSAKEIGPCMECKVGTLKIIQSQSSGKRFVGCTEYFNNKNCTVTFPLPQKGKLEPLDKPCKEDGYPRIRVFSGKRPWVLCLNPECPLREEYEKRKKQRSGDTDDEEESS